MPIEFKLYIYSTNCQEFYPFLSFTKYKKGLVRSIKFLPLENDWYDWFLSIRQFGSKPHK